jgi:lysophospholipase L1-like esterase
MAKTTSLRPSVDGLEQRSLLSSGPSPVSVPTPGNNYYAMPQWLAMHDAYLAQAQHQRRGGVVFLGDSITYLWGTKNQPQSGTAAWDRDFAPLSALNFGIPGDETQAILWRVLIGELSSRPRVVVLMAGINNLSLGDTPAETAAGDAAIIQAIHQVSPRTKVLLLDILPAHESSADPIRGEIGETNALLQNLVDGRKVFSLDLSELLTTADGSIAPGMLSTDHLHPSAAGYDRLAAGIDAPLLRLLTRR